MRLMSDLWWTTTERPIVTDRRRKKATNEGTDPVSVIMSEIQSWRRFGRRYGLGRIPTCGAKKAIEIIHVVGAGIVNLPTTTNKGLKDRMNHVDSQQQRL